MCRILLLILIGVKVGILYTMPTKQITDSRSLSRGVFSWDSLKQWSREQTARRARSPVAPPPYDAPVKETVFVQSAEPGLGQSPRSRQPSHERVKRRIFGAGQLAPTVVLRGCHLGTCQIQNLANLLYRIGVNNNKAESHRNTADPQGYGKRRRRDTRWANMVGARRSLKRWLVMT
ncbi:pro-adrenomedullin-like [Latimeria chalumnae]|uniref:pro-adrenomedullin-like n=1 Tax=Latimeria chalumnae TaxID=7897 RepID=UPI0003C188E8|nr:PREDICTED: ADM-like [Latimeria chalumnae]|eukprot:XP_005991001.1 PREDICTED: ADM-like [Latimeria chalumnae]